MYNTALKAEERKYVLPPDPTIYRNANAVLFQHDLTKGMHPLFKDAKAVYSEIAWVRGYQIFTKGTIAEDTTFKDYLDQIRKIIKDLNVPSFIMVGKQVAKMLSPDWIMPTLFHQHNDGEGAIAVFNHPEITPFRDERYCIVHLARNYGTILDFSCGYANILAPVTQYRNKAILSDINTDCIHWIRDKYQMKGSEK